jgi:Flp pilus assembly protein TadD
LFRVLALVAVPTLLFLITEACLRLANVGYPASFFLRTTVDGQNVLVENRRFGWRFFSREAARAPGATVMPAVKAPDTLRVFVFGESAAYGDPQPEFGMPRVLEVLLRERFPGKRIEVINVAMTAINSHVIVPLARECARLQGDVWVIYMGNNEAVGPFGPATVFGNKAPPLPMVRMIVALKRSRVVQLVDFALQRVRHRSAGPQIFGGMEMFSENKLRSDDRRMTRLYSHFERNLRDIVDAGTESRAEVLLCSVATNVKDCAPFASLHKLSLSADAAQGWSKHFASGVAAQQRGEMVAARQAFVEAAALDDRFAESHFRHAQSELALGNRTGAVKLFARARDEDALRFRTDSKLNDIIRRVAAQSKRARFLDVENLMSDATRDGASGGEFFYEHVHFNFDGNYMLAKTIASQLFTNAVAGGWLSSGQCAERLALNDQKRLAAAELLAQRTSRAPFTYQFDHEMKQAQAAREVLRLRAELTPEKLRAVATQYERAITNAPRDWVLRQSAAELLYAISDFTGAVRHCEALVKLVPHHPEGWNQLGLALNRIGRSDEAEHAFRRAFEIDPASAGAQYGIGLTEMRRNNFPDAQRAFTKALKQDPMFHPARVGLAEIFVAQSKTAEAVREYEQVLSFDPSHREARAGLNRLKFGDDATLGRRVTELSEAVSQTPADASLRLLLGKALVANGQLQLAKTNFAAAVQLDPNNAEAHYLLGQELARANQIDAALGHFQKAVELDPNDAEAHLNLGVALARARRFPEALSHFETVLRLAPTNTLARDYANMARAQIRR